MRDHTTRLYTDSELYQCINENDGQGDAIDLMQLVDRIKATEELLEELRDELAGRNEELCAAVAVQIRKLLSKVSTEMKHGSCIIKYGARQVVVKPNFDSGEWEITAGPNGGDKRMLRDFLRQWQGSPIADMQSMIQALARLFVGKYKTLQGGKVATPEEPEEPEEMIDSKLDDKDLETVLNALETAGKEVGSNMHPIEKKGTGGGNNPAGVQYA